MAKDAKTTKKLINEPKHVVTEFLEGLVSSVPNLQQLEGSPDVSIDPCVVLHPCCSQLCSVCTHTLQFP